MRWSLFQFSHHLKFGQNTVDGNAVNPFHAQIGTFGQSAAIEPVDFSEAFLLREQFQFSARRNAPVFDRPGGGQILELTLAYNQIVLTREVAWHTVSIDGRGGAFGWVEAIHLAPSRQMPEWQ